MLSAVFAIVPSLKDESIETLITLEWTDFSLRDNLYSAKFSVDTRVELFFPIEYVYFQ